ncbi:MAG: hypothetical protein QM811_06895 [Pirellulales bacterium]
MIEFTWQTDSHGTRTWCDVDGGKQLIADQSRNGQWIIPWGPFGATWGFYSNSVLHLSKIYDSIEQVQSALEAWYIEREEQV